MSSFASQQQLANSATNKNVVHTQATHSTADHQKTGNGLWNMRRDQSVSLQESTDVFNVNAYSVPALSALQGGSGSNFTDFVLPANCGEIKHLVPNYTLFNSGNETWVPECPVMPFAFTRLQVWQEGHQVGQDILPLTLWKYYGYTNSLNDMIQLQARSSIDSTTYALHSGTSISAKASKTFSIDWAPVLFICQARLVIKYCKPITLRFFHESVSVLAPSNTNSANGDIQLSNFNLQITHRIYDNATEANIASQYKGNVDGRCIQVIQELGSVVASSGVNIQYNTNQFNNVVCPLVDVCFRNQTPTGANICSFYPITQMYATDMNNVSLQNSLQPSHSDYLDLFYPQSFEDNVFTKASNINIYPLIVGSTRIKEALKHSRQLGYKCLPNRSILNITMPSSATYQIVISAWTNNHVRVQGGSVAVY